MNYFNTKGENHSGKELFDRDGFFKVDVQHEIANVDLNQYPSLSEIVRCHYTLKLWNIHPNEIPQTIFSRVK